MSLLECSMKEDQQSYLLKYIMVKLAPVLVKLKPSCLLCLGNYKNSNRENCCDLWNEQKADIAGTLKISFKEFKNTSWGKQVLFYNPELLYSTIRQPENLILLNNYGYSSCEAIEEYLKMLKNRFCASGRGDNFFPHEIGIFLGYPLKDVKGFIEKGSMPLTATGRWQVFGTPKESMQLMHAYKKAEEVLLRFVENQRNPLPYIGSLTKHFGKTRDITAIQAS